jgi:hypothetical protein
VYEMFAFQKFGWRRVMVLKYWVFKKVGLNWVVSLDSVTDVPLSSFHGMEFGFDVGVVVSDRFGKTGEMDRDGLLLGVVKWGSTQDNHHCDLGGLCCGN